MMAEDMNNPDFVHLVLKVDLIVQTHANVKYLLIVIATEKFHLYIYLHVFN